MMRKLFLLSVLSAFNLVSPLAAQPLPIPDVSHLALPGNSLASVDSRLLPAQGEIEVVVRLGDVADVLERRDAVIGHPARLVADLERAIVVDGHLDPFVLGELLAIERAANLSAYALHPHDPRAPETTEVPRHQGLADAQAPRELGYRLLAFGDEDLHDAQTVHVAERPVVAAQLAQARLAEDRSPFHGP